MPPLGEIADTAPGGKVLVRVDVPAACAADESGNDKGFPIYHSVTVSIPGGGRKTRAGLSLTFQCGMSATPFFTPKPSPTYAPNPVAGLVPSLLLPATVRAGTTLMYEVDLANPGSRPVSLSPCPAYLEHTTIPTKFEYQLDCRSVHVIAAHGHVRYQMEMAIPAKAPGGPARLWWSLFGPNAQGAIGQVRVR